MAEVRRGKALMGREAHCTFATPCLFGISVNGSVPSVSDLLAGWAWTKQRFECCAVLLGDSLQRLTLQIQLGLEPADAEAEAQKRAQDLLDDLTSGLSKSVKFLLTSQIASRPEYDAKLGYFTAMSATRKDFAAAIQADAAQFCGRQRRRGQLRTTESSAMNLAARYILEEVSVYALLAEEGWLAEVYTGSELGTLAKFMHGDFPGVSPELERRTHISIRVSRES